MQLLQCLAVQLQLFVAVLGCVLVAMHVAHCALGVVQEFIFAYTNIKKNLVFFDLTNKGHSHSAFLVMLPSDTPGSEGVKELLLFDDMDGGLSSTCCDEDSYAIDKAMTVIEEKWLFAGATIVLEDDLDPYWPDNLWGLQLACNHNTLTFKCSRHKFTKKKQKSGGRIDYKKHLHIQSCTSSAALAKFILMHYAGMQEYTNAWKVNRMLNLPDMRTVNGQKECTLDMSKERDIFMAYCVTFRQLGFFEASTFQWLPEVDKSDQLGQWELDKLEQAFIYGSQVKGENGIMNIEHKDAIIEMLKASVSDSHMFGEQHEASENESEQEGPERSQADSQVALRQVDLKLTTEQLQQTVPDYMRLSMLGSAPALDHLLGLPEQAQAEALKLNAKQRNVAMKKGFANIDNFGNQLVVTSVYTTNNRTVVMAVDMGKPHDASTNRLGDAVEDHRLKVGEVFSYSTILLDGHMNKVLCFCLAQHGNSIFCAAGFGLPNEGGYSYIGQLPNAQ